uniref:Uncharacterized protein n=1 Tax=viral metagenome TaxID=1070528 RepID=A0A6M3J1P4_9ZZZZ
MILDKLLEMSNGQAITIDAISDYSVGIDVVKREIGKGKQLYAVVVIDTAANAADAAKTITFSVISDSTANLATSAVVQASTRAYTGAVITAGREPIVIPIPPISLETTDLYYGMQYDVSATFTSFTLSAYIAVEVQSNT